MDNVQKRNICINVPTSQTFKSFYYMLYVLLFYKLLSVLSCFIQVKESRIPEKFEILSLGKMRYAYIFSILLAMPVSCIVEAHRSNLRQHTDCPEVFMGFLSSSKQIHREFLKFSHHSFHPHSLPCFHYYPMT
jgi:hypothetical protein